MSGTTRREKLDAAYSAPSARVPSDRTTPDSVLLAGATVRTSLTGRRPRAPPTHAIPPSLAMSRVSQKVLRITRGIPQHILRFSLTQGEAARSISGMEASPEQQEPETNGANEDGENGDGRRNIRSTIAFPYSGLADAEQIADALHRRGDSATVDEIAAELNQTTSSGSFRTKMATARVFGAIDVRRGQATLTPLGKRLVDPDKSKQARVEAFLHVPLYKQLYEAYKGHQLPGNAGIENRMAQFGVSSKQTEKARQALQKSAELAGFYESGRDRLVKPALSGPAGENDGMENSTRTPLTSPSALPAWAEQMWLTLLGDDAASWSPEQIKAYVDGARTAYKAQG